MKKFTIFLILTLLSLDVVAENYQNLYGLIDKSGKVVIEPRFEGIETPSEGLIAAKHLGLWGFIDLNGKWIIEPQFSDVQSFIHGLAAVKTGENFNYFGKYDKCGYIDKSGAWVIVLPNGFYTTYLSDFKTNGQAMIKEWDGQNQHYRFIDRQGNIVESAKDTEPEAAKPIIIAFEGENKKYGFKDQAGKVITAPKYDFASNEKDGLALIKVGNIYGFVDAMGKVVIEPCADIYGGSFCNGYGKVKIEGKPLPFTFTPTEKLFYKGFKHGLSPFQKDDVWGLIDEAGKIITPAYYKEMTLVSSDGYAAGLDGNSERWQVIDKNGTHILSVKSIVAPYFVDGLAVVSDADGELFGYIDINGKWVIRPQFSYASDFSDGIAVVRDKNNVHHYINKSGRYILNNNYTIADDFGKNLARVKVGKLWGIIDRNGDYVVEPMFTECEFNGPDYGWGKDADGESYFFNATICEKLSWFSRPVGLELFELIRIDEYGDDFVFIFQNHTNGKKFIVDYDGYCVSDNFGGFGSIHGDFITAVLDGKWTLVSLKDMVTMTPIFDYMRDYFGTGPLMVWYDKMWRPLDIDKVVANH